MRIGRKLEGIRQKSALLGEQGKTKGFFNNVENAEKLGGLVEDLRDVMMDYQVPAPSDLSFSRLTFFLDCIATGHVQQKFPTHR